MIEKKSIRLLGIGLVAGLPVAGGAGVAAR